MLVIDPEICIGCGLCEEYCPATAIFPAEEVPEKWEPYVELNARLAVIWPEIDGSREPLVDADEYKSLDQKRNLLDESPGEGS
jgi:ferredoxin